MLVSQLNCTFLFVAGPHYGPGNLQRAACLWIWHGISAEKWWGSRATVSSTWPWQTFNMEQEYKSLTQLSQQPSPAREHPLWWASSRCILKRCVWISLVWITCDTLRADHLLFSRLKQYMLSQKRHVLKGMSAVRFMWGTSLQAAAIWPYSL